MKILIVDDSLMDRKLNNKALKGMGIEYEALEAADGEEALQLLERHFKEIGLILLDWQMPKMDGLAFMKAVAQVPTFSSIPTIMITALTSPDNKKMAYEVNPHLAGYILKPYKPADLIGLVKSYWKESLNGDRHG